jgi:hypothetical protein
MSSAGSQLAARPGEAARPASRSPLANLLHALNQPVTGLQCSLELAVAGPRRPEQYVRTLREGLELTGRIRILVEAIRELSDSQESPDAGYLFPLDGLLGSTVADLLPVAENKQVLLSLMADTPLPVRASRPRLTALMFRFLDSALSLAAEGSELCITATVQGRDACLVLSWRESSSADSSSSSRPELGLLIAQAGWEQAGGQWRSTRTGTLRTCEIRLPLAPASSPGKPEMK